MVVAVVENMVNVFCFPEGELGGLTSGEESGELESLFGS